MSFLFDRTAQLRIGKAGQTGVLIKGLRVAFEITKTGTSESNKCTVIVNNLSDHTQSLIKANTGVLVELSAGYEEAGNVAVIFVGDIINVDHNITKPEVVTTIELEDGYGAIKSKRISKSYKSGTRLRQIVQDTVAALGLPEKTRLSLVSIPDIVFSTGFAFEGYAADALDRLCEDNGLEWSIQNNQIKITTRIGTDNTGALRTQLIGSPRRVYKMPKKDSTEEEFKGYEFDTLLLPQAEPGGTVYLESVKVSPAVKLKVVELHHSGDTHGDRWITTIKAKDL